jgi:thiol-disulfide isomerase/thioredoxin
MIVPPRARNALLLGVAGLLALVAGIGLALWDREPADASRLLALSLPDLNDKPQALTQWRGKVMVVNFWATWCGPCREEMPEFVRAQREFGDKGLQFVGIAVDQRDKVAQFAKDLNLNYPALIGGYEAMDVAKPLGNRFAGLPFTVVLDRQGHVAYTQLGPLQAAKLRSIVSGLL